MAGRGTVPLTTGALLALLLGSGCGALLGWGKPYPGPDLPSTEAAVVKGHYEWNWWQYRSVHIMAIDQDVNGLWKRRAVEAKMASGPHTVEIGFQSGNIFSPRGLVLTFIAEAGHLYEIHAATLEPRGYVGVAGAVKTILLSEQWTAWLIDTQTGTVVGGKAPPRCQDLGPGEQGLCWSSEL